MQKKPITPRSQIKSALRKIFLRSRERAAAIKRDKYTCQKCGVKQSKAKGKEVSVECHHVSSHITNWEKIYQLIYAELLCGPEGLTTLCHSCHEMEHKGEESIFD